MDWFEQMLRSMGWALCTFAPTYKKNLTPKFVFRTGTPGDYAAKVGKTSELCKRMAKVMKYKDFEDAFSDASFAHFE